MRRRRNIWFTQYPIPTQLHPAYGRAVLERSLKTDSESEAEIRLNQFTAKWDHEFVELEAGRVITPEALARIRKSLLADDDSTRAALEQIRHSRMRETLDWHNEKPWRDEGESNLREFAFDLMPDSELAKFLEARGIAPTPDLIQKVVSAISEADTGAKNLYNRNRDLAPPSSDEPIDSLLEDYFAQQALRPRQERTNRRVLAAFISWLKGKKVSATIGKVTKELVGGYVTGRYKPGTRGAKSVNNEVSILSRYWQFLVKKGKASFNPFEGQSLPRKLVKKEQIKRRPFTTDEMILLLTGRPIGPLADCIKILALHGMRPEELCQLRVWDCRDDIIRIYGGGDPHEIPKWHRYNLGKNESARRDIPVHSATAHIFRKRVKDKHDSEFLIHELKIPKGDLERSKQLGRMFMDYRKFREVHHQEEGQNQSTVVMRSFRNWFIKTAKEAIEDGAPGFTPWTVADVAGHDSDSMPLGMTMAHYPGSSNMKSKKACVEAVKLPQTVKLPAAIA